MIHQGWILDMHVSREMICRLQCIQQLCRGGTAQRSLLDLSTTLLAHMDQRII